MSAVMQRIRDNAKDAEATLAAIAAAATAPAEAPPAAPPAPVTAPPVEHGAHPVAPPPAPVAPPPAGEDDATVKALRAAEQRERTLQGMFNQQAEQLQILQRQLDKLVKDTETRAAAEAQRAAATSTSKLVTEADVKEFGDDTIDLVRRVVRESLGTVFAPLEQRLGKLEATVRDVGGTAARVAEVTAATEEERFFAKLGEADRVPDWHALNTDQRFLDWLKNRDMLSGVVRYQLLQDAFNVLDLERVTAIFKSFKADAGIAAPATEVAKGSGSVDLTTLASPGAAAPATQPANTKGKKQWTKAEVEQVYDDYTRGRMPKDEFLRKEAEITVAVMEGRVR